MPVAGTDCVDATSYLARFGVTITGQSAGTRIFTGAATPCFHGDVVVPSAPRALYVPNNQPVRFVLNFDRSLDSVRFVRARLNAARAVSTRSVGGHAPSRLPPGSDE